MKNLVLRVHSSLLRFTMAIVFVVSVQPCLYAAQTAPKDSSIERHSNVNYEQINYAEKVTALLPVLLESYANFKCENDPKIAAKVRIISNFVNTMNKSLNIYNSAFTKDSIDGFEFFVDNTRMCDYVVHIALVLYSLTRVYTGVRGYNKAKLQDQEDQEAECNVQDDLQNTQQTGDSPQESSDGSGSGGALTSHSSDNCRSSEFSCEDLDEIEELIKSRQAQVAKQPTSRLFRFIKGSIIPCLKGFSAYSLACVQPNLTEKSGRQARTVWTVANLLTTLLDEYSMHDSDTDGKLKKCILLVILGTAVWLYFEWSHYNKINANIGLDSSCKTPKDEEPKKPSFEMNIPCTTGECPICLENREILTLPCEKNSAAGEELCLKECKTCKACSAKGLFIQYKDGNCDCKYLRCDNCKQKLDMDKLLSKKGKKEVALYGGWYKREQKRLEEAAKLAARKNGEEKATEEFLKKKHIDMKPCPQCGECYAKGNACQHLDCQKCHTAFCFCCGKRIDASTHEHYDKYGRIQTIDEDCGFSWTYNYEIKCPNGCVGKSKTGDHLTCCFTNPENNKKLKYGGTTKGYEADVWCNQCKHVFRARIGFKLFDSVSSNADKKTFSIDPTPIGSYDDTSSNTDKTEFGIDPT